MKRKRVLVEEQVIKIFSYLVDKDEESNSVQFAMFKWYLRIFWTHIIFGMRVKMYNVLYFRNNLNGN